MDRIYYKVVCEDLTSACVPRWYEESGVIDKFCVQYIKNEWVYPKINGSKLMVFNHLDYAKKFARDRGWKVKIFECEIKNPSKKAPFIRNTNGIELFIEKCIELKKNKKKYSHLCQLESIPPGTIFCNAVKLTKEIC